MKSCTSICDGSFPPCPLLLSEDVLNLGADLSYISRQVSPQKPRQHDTENVMIDVKRGQEESSQSVSHSQRASTPSGDQPIHDMMHPEMIDFGSLAIFLPLGSPLLSPGQGGGGGIYYLGDDTEGQEQMYARAFESAMQEGGDAERTVALLGSWAIAWLKESAEYCKEMGADVVEQYKSALNAGVC